MPQVLASGLLHALSPFLVEQTRLSSLFKERMDHHSPVSPRELAHCRQRERTHQHLSFGPKTTGFCSQNSIARSSNDGLLTFGSIPKGLLQQGGPGTTLTMIADSTKRKRKRKMNKHKHKKRLKELRGRKK